MATRCTFLQDTAAVGAGIMLAQAQTVHAAEEPGYNDKLTDADGKYAAAPLPFAYDTLEPVIDANCITTFTTSPLWLPQTGLKTGWQKAQESNDFALVTYYGKELAFHLSSHIRHTIYWTGISGKGGEPKGDLAKAIDRNFGSGGATCVETDMKWVTRERAETD